MPKAVVTPIITQRSNPRHPARNPFQSYEIAFDGTVGDGLKSDAIEKIGLSVSDFSWPAFTVATAMTFEVGQVREGPFAPLDGVTVDLAVKRGFQTALLAGYAYYKILINNAEDNDVEVGHLGQ